MPNTRTVTFAWGGRKYQLPVLLARDAISFFEKEKELQAAHVAGDSEAQFKCCLDILRIFGCPEEVMNDLAIDEIQACMTALMSAKMSAASSGEKSGHPFEEKKTTPKRRGSSSQIMRDSSAAG